MNPFAAKNAWWNSMMILELQQDDKCTEYTRIHSTKFSYPGLLSWKDFESMLKNCLGFLCFVAGGGSRLSARRNTVTDAANFLRESQRSAAIQDYWVSVAGGDLSTVDWSKPNRPQSITPSESQSNSNNSCPDASQSTYPDQSLDYMLHIYGMSNEVIPSVESSPRIS